MGMTETASRLIAEYGQAAELVRPSQGAADGQGGFAAGPETVYACKVMVATSAVNAEFIHAGLMDVGDQRVMLSVEGLTITPETTDKLRIGLSTLRIKSVVPHAPGGKLFFWEIKARDLL